ncbi:hypothetical protein CH375_19865 [Leptospira ellisii]|uniref:Uncharacterized protein n=1 Tax=Leptospira ellisii TaxID=2023197 RepID=A0A2N0BCS8_9LEPT|nr:hypothetical protein CH379_02880 [Leptospira ellisii]PKA02960.1 hypothetical protein CH375_19865 [Leptospira ellisii]
MEKIGTGPIVTRDGTRRIPRSGTFLPGGGRVRRKSCHRDLKKKPFLWFSISIPRGIVYHRIHPDRSKRIAN